MGGGSVMVTVGDPMCCSPLDLLEGSHTYGGVGIPDGAGVFQDRSYQGFVCCFFDVPSKKT